MLEKAFISEEPRKQVFITDLKDRMEEYLNFRHFVRHSYSFQLEWEKMENLIKDLDSFWESIKENTNKFIDNS